MDSFENKQINGYTYATRFIMSWIRSGGVFNVRGVGYNDFKQWLKSLGLSDDDVTYVVDLAKSGKMELEYSAKKFIEEQSSKN